MSYAVKHVKDYSHDQYDYAFFEEAGARAFAAKITKFLDDAWHATDDVMGMSGPSGFVVVIVEECEETGAFARIVAHYAAGVEVNEF